MTRGRGRCARYASAQNGLVLSYGKDTVSDREARTVEFSRGGGSRMERSISGPRKINSLHLVQSVH
jgi:hypothetical protein